MKDDTLDIIRGLVLLGSATYSFIVVCNALFTGSDISVAFATFTILSHIHLIHYANKMSEDSYEDDEIN